MSNIFSEGDEGGLEQTPVPTDNQAPRTGSDPFPVTPDQAVPVNARSPRSFRTRSTIVSSASGGTTNNIVGITKGRKSITLSCPTTYNGATNSLGFVFAEDQNTIDVGTGFQVNPGDSVEIESEAAVFAAPLPGNSTGVLQWLETFSPLAQPSQ